VAATAIRTEGLTKRYGNVAALDHLDLEVAPGEVVGYLGPNGAGKTTTIRLLLGLINPTGGRGEIFGLDCQRQPVEAHRHLAFVPGEANLWPSLTGAETLHLLGRVQGHVDEAYRDKLVARFDLDPAKKVRAYSKGNRQKVALIAALTQGRNLLRRLEGKQARENREDVLGSDAESDLFVLMRAFRYAENSRFDSQRCAPLGINAGAAREAAQLTEQFLAIARDESLDLETGAGKVGAIER